MWKKDNRSISVPVPVEELRGVTNVLEPQLFYFVSESRKGLEITPKENSQNKIFKNSHKTIGIVGHTSASSASSANS